jgi:hypothetical protein
MCMPATISQYFSAKLGGLLKREKKYILIKRPFGGTSVGFK